MQMALFLWKFQHKVWDKAVFYCSCWSAKPPLSQEDIEPRLKKEVQGLKEQFIKHKASTGVEM